MDGRRELFRSFLLQHSSNPDACPAVMRTLEPYFAHADAGVYRLARRVDVPLQPAMETLSNAVGSPIARMLFIECGRFDHVTNFEVGEIWRRIAYDAGDDLTDRLEAQFPIHRPFPARRGARADAEPSADDAFGELSRLAERSLLPKVDAAIAATLPSGPISVLDRIRKGVRTALMTFLRAAITDDAANVRRFAALVTLAALVLPVQFSARERGAFLLFSA